MNHINMNPAFVTLLNFFMSFMNQKMKSRVSQH